MSVNWFLKSGQTLLDLMLPPRCLHCSAADSWFCESCVQQISFITTPVCKRCGTPAKNNGPFSCRQCKKNPLKFIDGIRVLAYFEDNPIRSAIHNLKYNNHKAVQLILAQLLFDAYQTYKLTADIIVPVPLHRSRFRERGYNQCELLARPLGKLLGLPVNTNTLIRTQKTKSQMMLGATERHTNVANAFACSDAQLASKKILLIDDVCTTGSTLDSCSAALKSGGAALVWGLTLAKAH